MLNNINVPEDEIIKWRRHIHENPELSFQEYETAQYIEDILKSFGNIEVTRPTKTSVLGVINGKEKGRTVMYRADIDGLPGSEETGLPFCSKKSGVVHSCGHDNHAAILLGTAKVLSSMKDKIKGTVKLVFQHGEEKGSGGAEIISAGILDDVDAVFGMHIITNKKTGLIKFVKGVTTTAADGCSLTIKGRGSHASIPENAVDPILVGSELVMALNTIVSRNISPKEMAVVSIGEFHSGNAANIIPDTARLSISIRSTSNKVRAILENRIKEIIEYVTKANGASYELNYRKGCSVVMSDSELVDLAISAAIKANGEGMAEIGEMANFSDDFSAYTDIKKGCYMFLGGGLAKDGYEYSNHNPKFIIDEAALAYGTRGQVQIILDYLNKHF